MLASAMEVTGGRYICENDACAWLGEEIRLIRGRKPYILGGRHALEAAMPKIEKSLKDNRLDYVVGVFEGYCTYDNAAKHATVIREKNCDCIVAVGGGKCMDNGKAISKLTGLLLGTIPTSLATCVACTNMAIMYENSGAFSGSLYPDRAIAFVLADLEILAGTPVRYIASGIVDAMAKYPELHFSQRGVQSCAEIDDACLQVAHGMAFSTWNILMANGRKAYSDNRNQVISNEFSAVANTNLIATGSISGLVRGSKQLAIAHALYNHSTTVFPEVWRSFLHGEIVSAGILLQEFYNDAAQEEIDAYVSIAKDLGAPVCLHDLGIEGTAVQLDALYRAIMIDFPDFSEAEAKKLRDSMERFVKI